MILNVRNHQSGISLQPKSDGFWVSFKLKNSEEATQKTENLKGVPPRRIPEVFVVSQLIKLWELIKI